MTTIANLANGDIISEAWVDSVTNFLNDCAEDNTYTPTLVNAAAGTGGSASNSAHYTYVGGPAVGDKGVMHVSHTIVLGTSGCERHRHGDGNPALRV